MLVLVYEIRVFNKNGNTVDTTVIDLICVTLFLVVGELLPIAVIYHQHYVSLKAQPDLSDTELVMEHIEALPTETVVTEYRQTGSENSDSTLNHSVESASFKQPVSDPYEKSKALIKVDSKSTCGPLRLVKVSQSSEALLSGRKTQKAPQTESESRLTSLRQSMISETESGLLLSWRDNARQEGRTATQILASHSLVIREMEKDGVIPAGFYDRYKGGDQESNNTSNNAIEEVDSCDKSIELNSGLLRAERQSKQRKPSSHSEISPKLPLSSLPDKLKNGRLYIDDSDED